MPRPRQLHAFGCDIQFKVDLNRRRLSLLSVFSYIRKICLLCAKEHMNEVDIQKTNQYEAYSKTQVKSGE